MNVPLSLLWGASGRSVVAWLRKEEVDRAYAQQGRAPVSGEPLPSREVLEQSLASIGERGYVVSTDRRSKRQSASAQQFSEETAR
jgi:IclR family transcriptional regulator, acetate operon repressor